MSIAIIHTRSSFGIDAPLVSVEVHISLGLPTLSIVGLPETAVKESKDRVRSALINSYFEFPTRRITVNLAPADLPKKEGGRFDLPIAIGVLAASGQLPSENLAEFEFAGELALDGTLRGFNGALPFAIAARNHKHKLIIPYDNAAEAALPQAVQVFPAKHLLEVCAHLKGEQLLQQYIAPEVNYCAKYALDLSDVHGQEHAKRALEIAAAGKHSLLMMGPPGTGKTMLALRLPSILPEMTEEEALAAASIASICGKKINYQRWKQRPFRAPHHTASSVALVGGSSPPRPGEISLAHHGILFLDELPEFNRNVLEALREPLESGAVTISRAAHQARFPAEFQLIAAMNPCPCGYLGDTRNTCHCTREQIQRYQARISGPVLDRIDMHLEVGSLPQEVLFKHENIESSATVCTRVCKARAAQLQRNHKPNAVLVNKEIDTFCRLDENAQKYLVDAMTRLHCSARAYHRILKVARTIADLDGVNVINTDHLAEALGYRKKQF